jgi:hypothetical protein
LKSYGRYVGSLLLKTELSVTYLSKEFLKGNIPDLLKHLITSNLITASPEVTRLRKQGFPQFLQKNSEIVP